ncbi:MAG: hypothetical protein E3J72_20400 [Planctomycetota bacterium]|nr:MAG: hypothetical protein E3J72_20400 [Planctomycetota bacterium]
MTDIIWRSLAALIVLITASGCPAPEKVLSEIPPPRIKHKERKVTLSRAARKDIDRLIKELEDPKTIMGRDPVGSNVPFHCSQIDNLAEYGKKAIPSLQKEYLRLKKTERKIVKEFSGVGMTALDKLMEERYIVRTRRYAVMQALLRIKHPWNVEFFAVELCAHYDPETDDFARDELNRGDQAVRVRAAKYLLDNGDEKSIHNLVWALWDDDRAVKRMAATALRRLTGEGFGVSNAATEREMDEAVAVWWDWYQDYLFPEEE